MVKDLLQTKKNCRTAADVKRRFLTLAEGKGGIMAAQDTPQGTLHLRECWLGNKSYSRCLPQKTIDEYPLVRSIVDTNSDNTQRSRQA